MNVSYKCSRYGLLDPSYTERAVHQTTNVSACAMKINPTEDCVLEEKTEMLREDLIVGIYRIQTMKENDSALYYVGETDEIAEEFDISKNCEDIKSIIFENKENHNNFEY